MSESTEDREIAEYLKKEALELIELSKKHFDLELDFSEISLKLVDDGIAEFFPEGTMIEDSQTPFIAYVGETIIRNLGGYWTNHPQYGTVLRVGPEGQLILVGYWVSERFKDPTANSFVPHYLNAKKVVKSEEDPILSTTPCWQDDERRE